jgi:hypothetical protein
MNKPDEKSLGDRVIRFGMNPPLTKPSPWHLVMRELTGARLSLYDELLRHGMAEPRSDDTAEAARWLRYHRLAWLDDLDGTLRPREIGKARELWEAQGPASALAGDVRAKPMAAVATQDHQVEFLAMEGYHS